MTDHRQINFRLSRSRTIAAPAAAVFPLIASFHEWQKWSPWEGVDPDLKRTFTGPDSGLGARYEWSGTKKAGAGTMEVIEADEPTLVVVDLRFLKPFKAENLSTFTLTETHGETRVDWVMTGHRVISSCGCWRGSFPLTKKSARTSSVDWTPWPLSRLRRPPHRRERCAVVGER